MATNQNNIFKNGFLVKINGLHAFCSEFFKSCMRLQLGNIRQGIQCGTEEQFSGFSFSKVPFIKKNNMAWPRPETLTP